MSLPRVTNTVGGYDYEWEAERIRIEVRRLALHSGDVSGEVTISTTAPGVKASHLHQAKFNFSSSNARTSLAKTLKTKLEAEWDGILEQAAVYTLRYFRQGEPVVHLSTETATARPPEYLLYPFLIKNYPTVFFGDPSSSKSLTAQVLSAIMILPWYGNPLGLKPPGHSLKILYLDWETDEHTSRWSLACLANGMELGLLDMDYRRCTLPLCHDTEAITQIISDCGIDITIIDSLGLAAGGELNSTESALNFWTAWRSLKTTSLILAHVAKNGEDKKRSVYGNQYFTAEARSIWEIKKSQENDSNEMDVALFNRKPPPFAKIHSPFGIHYEFGGDGEISDQIFISTSRPETIDEFVKVLGTQKQVELLLKEDTLTYKEISETLSISMDNTRHAIKRLKDKGRIVSLPENKWGLAAHV